MPKHIIEFNLPEEKEELQTTLKSGSYHSVLWEYSMYLRNKYKHTDFKSEEARIEFEENRDKFYEILRDEDVEL